MVEVQVQLCPEGGGECGGGAVVVLLEGGGVKAGQPRPAGLAPPWAVTDFGLTLTNLGATSITI